MLKITLGDGQVECTQELRYMSLKIMNALEGIEEEEVEIPLPEIKLAEFELIKKYCEHHKFQKMRSGIPCPLPRRKL